MEDIDFQCTLSPPLRPSLNPNPNPNPKKSFQLTSAALIDDKLMDSGEFTAAIIMSHEGEPWAASDGCAVSQQEREAFAALWAQPAQARKNGFSLLGKRFACKTIDGERLTGAGVSAVLAFSVLSCFLGEGEKRRLEQGLTGFLWQSEGGVVAYRSEEAITVGIMEPGRAFGLATIQIVGLGEYFRENGY
ncbi:MAG: hypothetical protein LQ342_002214 [Letrouitia transgressa]|nr:MAG: hypothetical protein LQ342_002214 [Letrouitia transgressa]